ncbi:MAG: MarR family transcriptional regulator, partial [Chlorobiaceae bacterium]|nr:MarR family transcriptional regulator [Chlorobiaceae bacterium]
MQSTEKGAVFPGIVLEVFNLRGLLAAEGDRLTKGLGLSGARRKVLGALSIAGEPVTVAKIARTMGQTRQDVQRISDEMARDGIVEYLENPHHKRAKNMVLTPKGKEVCEQLSELQVPWAEEKSTGTRLK